MAIAINGRYLSQTMTGVQRFASEIVRALGEMYPGEIVVYAPPTVVSQPPPGVEYKQVGRRTGHLWEQIDLPRALSRDGGPSLLSLCNTGPLLYRAHYFTLHDVTFRRFPKGFSRAFRTAYAVAVPLLIRRARRVFTVSEFSAGEIADVFHVNRDRIVVIRNSVSSQFSENTRPRGRSAHDSYFMTIGWIGSNKDVPTLLEGFHLYRQGGGTSALKIIGGGQNIPDYVPEGVEYVGRITDEQLGRFYAQAEAYISASLYEGFGIPLIEAQASGCPVIASRIGIHEEVLGETATFFEPRSGAGLAATLHAASRGELQSTVSMGVANAQRFSWRESAALIARQL